MSPEMITEIRSLVCGAMADIGAACERLRELEDPYLRSVVLKESRGEIAAWLAAASDSLSAASLQAICGGSESSQEKNEEQLS